MFSKTCNLKKLTFKQPLKKQRGAIKYRYFLDKCLQLTLFLLLGRVDTAEQISDTKQEYSKENQRGGPGNLGTKEIRSQIVVLGQKRKNKDPDGIVDEDGKTSGNESKSNDF
eukprot:TRINITY_DN2517_c0_g1_i8.p4 TRINITY_DN2517_c0_g1~~TRINITY_DN2517_c0_g1_i8.p4  ORF type:complete len:112 (-),score=5.46 TRINITY_DN2517_c0_g1_i8:144-479(-)